MARRLNNILGTEITMAVIVVLVEVACNAQKDRECRMP